MAENIDVIDYASLVREALRTVPRKVLEGVAARGLPGEHHFLLGFRTTHPDVRIPSRLRLQYPDEMTVVLQFQFSSLSVDEQGFAVTLRFGGRPESIFVPFAALTSFVDPSAEFGLRFDPQDDESSPERPEEKLETPAASSPEETAESNVIHFGSFRRS